MPAAPPARPLTRAAPPAPRAPAQSTRKCCACSVRARAPPAPQPPPQRSGAATGALTRAAPRRPALLTGNGRLEAQCIDGTKRLCHIRGKMRKKVWVNTVRAAFGPTQRRHGQSGFRRRSRSLARSLALTRRAPLPRA